LRRAQRKVARRKKGSNRRTQSGSAAKEGTREIANKRLDFLHKTLDCDSQKFGLIAIEDLNVAGMSKGNLAQTDFRCELVNMETVVVLQGRMGW